MTPIVVKVGGSLFDWVALKPRLTEFLDSLAPPILLVPGGGALADAIRDMDRVHGLGAEASHWLALRACTFNGHMLAQLLGNLPVLAGVSEMPSIAVVDLFAFAEIDESRPDHWPHRWDVTSDSMAVRVANIASARELILLKSANVDADWALAAANGQVDSYFPTALARTSALRVRAVNLRSK